MQPEPTPPGADRELERDWFWTGVPAGFIMAVVAALGWLLGGIWAALVVALLLIVAGAVWAGRDGGQCRAMFIVGSLLLLLPGLIVEYVVFHHFLQR